MLCRQRRVSDPKMLQIVGRFLLVLVCLSVSFASLLWFQSFTQLRIIFHGLELITPRIGNWAIGCIIFLIQYSNFKIVNYLY